MATAGLAACGSGGGAGPGGSTGLEAALARVADTSSMRSFITYDDTAALVKTAGSAYAVSGYTRLIGNGASALIPFSPTVQSQAGINVLGEQYAISAGQPPATVGLLAGGQNAAEVAKKLTGQGWKRQGQRLVMLPLSLSNPLDGETVGWLSQVQPTGSDVVYGQPQADLSLAGAPSGQTLGQDARISELANCLGDVVAADITSMYPLSTLKPSEVAVGITRPASNATVPHAVVCVSWPSSAADSQYAAALQKALSSGYSLRYDERWSAILRGASVTTVGGSQNVVQWQAQTPHDVLTVFDMLYSLDLPALTGKV
jgi:hypothetical protein